jgi:hypothetical protein
MFKHYVLGATNQLHGGCTTLVYITMSANRTLYRVSCPILCVISSQVQCFLAVGEHIHPSQTLLKCLSSMEPPRSVLCRGLSTLEVEDLTSSRVRSRCPSGTGTCRCMKFIYICNTHQCGEVGATTWLCNLGATSHIHDGCIPRVYIKMAANRTLYRVSCPILYVISPQVQCFLAVGEHNVIQLSQPLLKCLYYYTNDMA